MHNPPRSPRRKPRVSVTRRAVCGVSSPRRMTSLIRLSSAMIEPDFHPGRFFFAQTGQKTGTQRWRRVLNQTEGFDFP